MSLTQEQKEKIRESIRVAVATDKFEMSTEDIVDCLNKCIVFDCYNCKLTRQPYCAKKLKQMAAEKLTEDMRKESEADVESTKETQSRNESSAVAHPKHYNQIGRKECIEEMRDRFGKNAVIHFCLLNAYKYQYRADLKGKRDEDMQKAQWYIDYANRLIRGDIK